MWAKKFAKKDAKKVLQNSIFIPAELKEEIAQEFKESKINFAGKVTYKIIRDDFNIYIEKNEDTKRYNN